MILNFNENDQNAFLSTLNIKDIINSITLNDVKNFLESLGVDQITVNEDKQYLVCPTICHNPIHEAESMKLYWYQNNKIFKCYTECDEPMSIFELYQKYMALNYYPITLEEAENYVKQFLQHIIVLNPEKRKIFSYDEIYDKYQYNNKIPLLPEYPRTVLDCFTTYYHPAWLKDGITEEVMNQFNIKFSLSQNKIIIPHFDIQGRLVGIRARTLEKKETEQFGKYRPIQIGKTLYSHPLQFNLYGIHKHKNAIQQSRSAIICEGEKSVLLDRVYYNNYANAVACCGSTFNKYHISLLTDFLGVNEIIIALDKEYTDWRTEKAKKYKNKIESMCNKYKNQANFSYIWDFDNVLNEKDSPFDKGKEIFEHLYKTKVKMR